MNYDIIDLGSKIIRRNKRPSLDSLTGILCAVPKRLIFWEMKNQSKVNEKMTKKGKNISC